MTEQLLDIITCDYYDLMRWLKEKPVLTAEDIRKIAYSSGSDEAARAAVWNAHLDGSLRSTKV